MRTLRLTSLAMLICGLVCLAEGQTPAQGFTSMSSKVRSSTVKTLSNATPKLHNWQLAKLTSSNGKLGDDFGYSVAASGNTVVVGVAGLNFQNQMAYVFEKPASGWQDMTETAQLTPSDPSNTAEFGRVVAISGNTIVVGSGSAAYVYVMPAGGWQNMTETAQLSGPYAGELEVAINNNTIVFGGANPGNAYVFVRPASGWKSSSEPNATLVPPFYTPSGESVGVYGDTIAVGILGNFSGEGTVYVYVKPVSGWQGTLDPTATLAASDGNFGDDLGTSVVVGDGLIIAGAPGHRQDRGAIYIFVEPPGGWRDTNERAELIAANSLVLGYAISITENSQAVVGGAADTTVGSNQLQGAAYVFSEPSTGWQTTSKFAAELVASDGEPGYELGLSVSASGTFAVAGAPETNIGSNTSQGATYIFGK